MANTDNHPAPDTHNKKLQRGMKGRHLSMIAIGGSIGTGLFVASGATINTAGPGGALLAYALIGIMVWFLMQSLGEMATYLPVAGSFGEYSRRFVSPSFGFAMGWNYWYNWSITVAAELVAAALVMQYWLPDVPAWVWSAIFLALLFIINAFSAGAYGESEFWFAFIKVATVIIFLVLGLAMIVGILGSDTPVGFANWTKDGNTFKDFPLGILAVFMIAGFSFQGTEMVRVAAGEARNPEKTIPKAINTVFWRILLFYIFAIVVIAFLIPYDDPRLLNDSGDITLSPFTLVFDKVGIAAAASIMNALLATTAIGFFAFLTSLIGNGAAYVWLVNASGLAGFITWCGIAWSHYKFRKAYTAQGHDVNQLPFKAALYPLGPIIALVMCLVVIAGQNLEAFTGKADFVSLLTAYIGLPLFLALWLGHKLITKAPAVKPEEADFTRPDDLD